ncbi:MAG TPA: NADH-quinone oxidoreductase subunit N [Terriglobales bacterium]|jgi:NADH-quinone oxidoreductase subunit N|nr:NADH-quinone oxidoreductase subunit N [Terriglobales bacterium]
MNPIHGIDYICVLPEIILTVFGMAIMMADPLLAPKSSRKPLGALALFGAIASALATVAQGSYLATQSDEMGKAFFGMIAVNSFSIFFHLLIALIVIVIILASYEYLEIQHINLGEYYGLILFGAVGMMLMSSATELVLIFIALEISSISTYILAGFRRKSASSSESSLKYFLLGSFATAFFLYGVALMFGATGSTSIAEIARQLKGGHTGPLAFVALALMFVGLGFKIASAPFHIWTPDVYEGAPAPVVGLMSTAPKAAVFAVLLRILFTAASAEAFSSAWFWLVWVSAALSMTLGNIGALVQNNVKRMLAYSSIAHAGYILVAFLGTTNPQVGISAAIFYTASYAAMNVGAFCIISHLAGSEERYVTLDDYAGLSQRSPWLAAMLSIFMLSLIGIPPTAGFFAKYYVFNAALQANLVGLAVIGLINSAVAAYYYLRLIVVMYMRESKTETPVLPVPASLGVAVVLSAVATLYLGIWPQRVLDYAVRSAHDLIR